MSTPTPAELVGLARLALDLGYPGTAAGILTDAQATLLASGGPAAAVRRSDGLTGPDPAPGARRP